MTSDLESRKSPRKRAKAPVNAGLAGWLRGIGVRAIVLYACAYGGMVALGVALVATATGGDASAPPELPLHASAGDLTRETPLAMTPDAGRVGGPDDAQHRMAGRRAAEGVDLAQEHEHEPGRRRVFGRRLLGAFRGAEPTV